MTRDEVACPIDDNSIVFGQSWMDVLHRACRNCPRNPDLQMKRLRMGHHYSIEPDLVESYTQQAYETTFRTGKFHVEFWQDHISHVYRTSKKPEQARALLGQAAESIKKCGGDPCSEFARFAGEFECGQLGNADDGYMWYEEAMRNPINQTRAALWLEFAQSQLVADQDRARR